MRIAMAALSLSLGLTTSAFADDLLAGGNLFGGPTQTRVVCSFFNAGNQPVSIISPRLLDQFGTSFPLTGNQCDDTPTLAANRTCGIFVDINAQRSWSCRARISPNKQNVRGVLDIRDTTGSVLANTELR